MTRYAVPWIGGLLIAAVLALAGYDIYASYHGAVRDTGRELHTHARMISEQTARTVQAVDVHLRHLVEQYYAGNFSRLSRQELRDYLQEQSVGLVQAEGLLIIRPSGEIQGSSYLPLPVEVRVNVTGEAPFEAQRSERNLSLSISDAQRSSADQKWMFVMSRRLEAAGGAFGGVIAARGKIDYFQDFYRDLRLDAGTNVTLMKHNGTMLARHPPVEKGYGRSFGMFHDVAARYGQGEKGPVRLVSPYDNVERFAVVHSVPGYPLSVVVTRDVDVALAPWRQHTIGTLGRTLALAALAAVLLALLARQLGRLYRAQESLQVQQERFTLAVEGSDDGIWDFDFANQRVFASARARELSGLPPRPEMQSMDEWFASLPLHPQDAPKRLAAMEAHLSGRTPVYVGEFRLKQPDGEYRWRRLHGVCLRDASGKPFRMAGSITDVDTRRRAEEALRESQERFALAVAGSNDGIVDWDVVNDRMYSSPRAMEIMGVKSDVTLRTRAEWRELVVYHPDDAARVRTELRAFLDGPNELRDAEYRVKVGAGQYRWIRHRNKCIRDAQGKPLRVSGSVSDIDAQKRAEEELRASEEQYRAIFDATADALVLRDADLRVIDVNPAFLEMSGYAREEVIGETRMIFVQPEETPYGEQTFARALAGEHMRYEVRGKRKDGSAFDLEIRSIPIRYRGRPHMLGIGRDITAQKRAETERARLEGQLLQAKKLEAIGTLAGGIAHDFNNILAAILGYGEMAQKAAPEGSALRRHVDAVVNAGLRAKSLVARILAFSRSGIGERVAVNVEAVVGEALDLVAASLPFDVKLVRRLSAGDAAVMGDPTQIHQVVMNLCANAVQAMKSIGRLTVFLDVVDKTASMAATSPLAAGRYVRLRVRDTGSGIPAKVLERIFDPFFTTKGVGVGTGLGLSLVHGIVTDLGGGIDVESRVGEGSTFTVYLPFGGEAPAGRSIEREVARGNGETVLLVDDEEALVRLGEEMIAELGYEPVGFTSSAAALKAFRASPERFNAVLSDETMPEMTGSDLAREIRSIRPDMPVVLMTGFISPALSARARDIGVAEVLAKPLVAADIARSLAGVFNP
jgi:PAS domain S-box-containing protein